MKRRLPRKMQSSHIIIITQRQNRLRKRQKAGAKQLILTHISARYQGESPIERLEHEAKAVFENSKIAFDFMEVTVERS